MNQQAWHVSEEGLSRFMQGEARATERHSIETHLVGCDRCRGVLVEHRGLMPTSDRIWEGILDRVELSRRSLRWSTAPIQVSIASPSLIAATFGLASVLLVAVGVLSAFKSQAALPLLIALAPLAPPVGAVIAFHPGIDPAGKLTQATPLAGRRILFLRAGFSTLVAIMAGLIAAAFTPLGWSSVLIWLAPSLSFTAVVAAAATWTNPARLAVIASTLWMLVVFEWARGHQGAWTRAALDELAVSRPLVQTAFITASVVAAIVCIWRRDAQPGWRTA